MDVRKEVMECLDNSYANGYDPFSGTALAIAEELVELVADLEGQEPSSLAEFVAEWRLKNSWITT